MSGSHWFWICLHLAMIPVSYTGQQILYYTSPGNRDYNAGVFGDDTRHLLNGTVARPRPVGYHCLNHDGVRDAIYARHMSYDPRMGSVLLQLDVDSEDALTLVRAPVCTTNTRVCRQYRNDPMEALFLKKRFGREKVGPVLMYDNEVYMVVTRQTRGTGTRHNIIEMRKLRPCKNKLPIRSSDPFDWSTCTKLISVLVHENYTTYPSVTPAASILAVPEGAYPTLFLQVRNLTYTTSSSGSQRVQRYNMQLLRVSEQDGNVGVVHSESIDPGYQLYDIQHLGGISYKDKQLCWSTVDRILCGVWSGGRMQDKRLVLKPGQAKAACLGVREGDLLRNVTTGLVIKQTNRVLELYFGCVAQGTSRGGAGYLRLRQGTNVPQVYPLRNRTTRLLAGSMFLTDICSKPAVESWISGGTAWRVHVVLATLLPFLLSLWMAAIFGKA